LRRWDRIYKPSAELIALDLEARDIARFDLVEKQAVRDLQYTWSFGPESPQIPAYQGEQDKPPYPGDPNSLLGWMRIVHEIIVSLPFIPAR
jgi:hypothetical protein